MAVLRKTKTVESLINFFNESEDPISILELVDEFDGTMDKSTVYRILERLEDSNILHSFVDGMPQYGDSMQIDNKTIINPDEFKYQYLFNVTKDSTKNISISVNKLLQLLLKEQDKKVKK